MRSRSLALLSALSSLAFACSSASPGAGGTAGSGGGSSSSTGSSSTGSSSTGSSSGTAGSGGGAQACAPLDPIPDLPETVYVAPDGDDAADGSAAHPILSLGEAATRLPAGGTVIVRGGVYGDQWLSAKGTAAHPLVIRAAEGETPVFDGGAVTADWSSVITLDAAENVVLMGLEIRSCAAFSCTGIDAPPVTNLTVRGCHIHHMDGPAARFTGKTIRIEGNHFHDIALTNVDNVMYPNGGWPTCTGTVPDRDQPATPHADDVAIRDNLIENCWGEGIGVWFASHAVVEGNVIDNPFNVGIYLDNSFEVTISRNFVRVLRGLGGSAGSGISMGTEPYDSWGLVPSSTHDVTITDNVVTAGGGIGWWQSSETSDANTYARVRVIHNSVVATSGGALGFEAVGAGHPTPTECALVNNALAEAGGSDLGDPGGWTATSNAWLNGASAPIAGAGDTSVTVPAGMVTKAADVQGWAALVGKGAAGTGVAQDFICQARDAAAPTRGAFEH